jgi:precorrin-3B methylase
MGSMVKDMDFFIHVLREVQNASHNVNCGQHVVCVKCVDNTMFGLAKLAVLGIATQHEQSKVVRVDDGCRAINHIACLDVIIERLRHEMNILSEGLSWALAKHEVV